MKLLIIFLLHFIFRTQNADAKEIILLNNYRLHQNPIHDAIQSKELANLSVNQLLSISDLWNKIKNSVTNAWNAIKDIASKTKEKLNVWLQNVKKRAEEAIKAFQAKLEVLKDKFNQFIEKIKKIAGDVKQCIEEDKNEIQELLKQIAQNVASCIANSIKTASVLDNYQSKLTLDDTEFMNEAKAKMNKCIQKVDDPDDCLNKVRGEIYDDMEHKETGIMDTRAASRDLVEDALETIMKCAADGVLEASEAITQEVQNIVNCVLSEKEKPLVLNKFRGRNEVNENTKSYSDQREFD